MKAFSAAVDRLPKATFRIYDDKETQAYASYENNGERSAEWCIAGSAGIGYRFRTR